MSFCGLLWQASFFGEMALLSDEGRSIASVRVASYCEGYCLRRDSYHSLTGTYPSFTQYLQSVARLRLQARASLSATVQARARRARRGRHAKRARGCDGSPRREEEAAK